MARAAHQTLGRRRARAKAAASEPVQPRPNQSCLLSTDCHPERTREGSGPAVRRQILREYAQDDTCSPKDLDDVRCYNRCPIFAFFVWRYALLCCPGETRIGTSSTTVSPYPS